MAVITASAERGGGDLHGDRLAAAVVTLAVLERDGEAADHVLLLGGDVDVELYRFGALEPRRRGGDQAPRRDTAEQDQPGHSEA